MESKPTNVWVVICPSSFKLSILSWQNKYIPSSDALGDRTHSQFFQFRKSIEGTIGYFRDSIGMDRPAGKTWKRKEGKVNVWEILKNNNKSRAMSNSGNKK